MVLPLSSVLLVICSSHRGLEEVSAVVLAHRGLTAESRLSESQFAQVWISWNDEDIVNK